jgi:SAM-dependent methyltransferase
MPERCAIKYKSVWKLINCRGKVSILDIGARDKSFLYYAPKNKKNYDYESLDIKSVNVTYIADICKPVNIRKKYDYVVMLDVIEHLENPLQALHNIKKLLKQCKGRLILTTANCLSYRRFIKSLLRKKVENPNHIFSFNKETLTNLLKRAGYKILNFQYISWIPFLFIPSNEGFLSELILVVCTPK